MTEIRRALVSLRWDAKLQHNLVEALAPAVVDIVDFSDLRAVSASLRQADVAIIAGNADLRFVNARNLRWLHFDHAGIDRYAPTALLARVIVTTSAGRSAPALAEHAMYLMMALCQDEPRLARAQRRRVWGVPGLDQRRALFGRRVCIVGTGHTGTELARRCRAFGMTVIGYRRRDVAADPAFDECYARDRGDRLVDAAAGSDVLVVAAGLNNDSLCLVGPAGLDALRPGALFVNVGRGNVVEEPALIEALQRGHLAGAGLDVVYSEPLSVRSPLWKLPNVVITPHASPRLPDRDARSFQILHENIDRYRADEPLHNVLTVSDAFDYAPPRSDLRTRVWSIMNRRRYRR